MPSTSNVIPLRPITSALAQAQRMDTPVDRDACIRRVLDDLQHGHSGMALAGELQRRRLRAATAAPGGAA